MKFICLFFAVVFLGRAQSDEAEVEQAEEQQGDPLEDLNGPQDENPALPAGYDEALKNEGKIQWRNATGQCKSRDQNYFFAICPCGSVPTEKCSSFESCCKELPLPRNPIVCNSMGGKCRHKCGRNEKSVGGCFATLSCCVHFQ